MSNPDNYSFPPWYPEPIILVIGAGYLFYTLLIASSVFLGFKSFKTIDKPFRQLVFLCAYIFVSEVVSRILRSQDHSNHILYHILVPIQAVFYGYIFKGLLAPYIKTKLPLVLGFLLGLSSIFISIFSSAEVLKFPSFNISLLSIFMILGSLSLFFYLILKPSDLALFRIPSFWFASGNLIFFAGSFLVFGLYEWIIRSELDFPEWTSLTIYILNLLLYATYLISVYLNAENNRTAS